MIKKKLFFPLSFKILTLFLILLIFIFSIFITFSINLFWSDKEINTYHQIHYHLDSKAMLIEQYIQNQVTNFKTVFNTMDEKGIKIDNSLFDEIDFLLEGIIYDQIGEKFVESFAILDEKKFPQYKFDIDSIKNRGDRIENAVKAIQENTIFFKIVAGKNTLPYLLAGRYFKQYNKIVIFRLLLENFLGQVYQEGIIDHFLMDLDGNMLTHTNPSAILTKGPEYFLKIHSKMKQNSEKSIVKHFRDENDNSIMGMKKIEDVGLITYSQIPYEKAFQSTQIFITKIVSFGILIISISVLLSGVLAYFITGPIKKLISSIEEVGKGNYNKKVIVNSRDEIEKLANNYNEMIDLIKSHVNVIEAKNSELQQSNFTLEKKVNDRTKELKNLNTFMKTMINSLDEGLMVFDEKGKCLPIFTNACEKILGFSPKGKNIGKILNWSENMLANSNQWLTHIFQETIDFKDLVKLVPQVIHNENDIFSDKYKNICIEFSPMKEGTKFIGLCAVISDKTETVRANAKRIQEAEKSNIIFKISTNLPIFIQYIDNTKKLLSEIKESIETKNIDVMTMLRNLHSMKGTSGLFALKKMVDILHHHEGELKKITENQKEEQIDLNLFVDSLTKAHNEISTELNQITFDYRDLAGEALHDGIQRVPIKLPSLEQFLSKFTHSDSIPLLKKDFITSFLVVPISSALIFYNEIIRDLAPKFNKKINPLKFHNGETLIRRGQYQDIFTNLIHLFRNSIDHGIETTEERILSQKPEEGTILISVGLKNHAGKEYLILEIQDDGKGINVSKVKEKLETQGISTLGIPDSEIIMHIFDDNFSTKDQITTTSGRGVGMSAVKKAVQNAHGSILLQNNPGRGTKFIINLPYNIY